jgi:hypothetical protein
MSDCGSIRGEYIWQFGKIGIRSSYYSSKCLQIQNYSAINRNSIRKLAKKYPFDYQLKVCHKRHSWRASMPTQPSSHSACPIITFSIPLSLFLYLGIDKNSSLHSIPPILVRLLILLLNKFFLHTSAASFSSSRICLSRA